MPVVVAAEIIQQGLGVTAEAVLEARVQRQALQTLEVVAAEAQTMDKMEVLA